MHSSYMAEITITNCEMSMMLYFYENLLNFESCIQHNFYNFKYGFMSFNLKEKVIISKICSHFALKVSKIAVLNITLGIWLVKKLVKNANFAIFYIIFKIFVFLKININNFLSTISWIWKIIEYSKNSEILIFCHFFKN